MTVTGTGPTFAAWLTQRRYSPATVRTYLSYVGRAERAVGGLEGACPETLYDWWTTLRLTAASRNGARKALIAFYKSRGSNIGWPAVELPQWAEPDRRPRPVNGPAFSLLRAAAVGLGGAHQTIAVLLATTGCRITEARLARWEQFTFDDDPPSWRITGKGAGRRGPKERDVLLHETAVRVLRDWRENCGSRVWVFPSVVNPGRPVADNTLRRRVYDIALAAGVDDHVNPHRWRHTVGTATLDDTGNLAAVQDLLGHSNPATTRKYAQVSVNRMRQVVDAAAAYGAPHLHAVS